MNLACVSKSKHSKLVHALAKSLEKQSLITRERDLEKAIELACCLQVLDDRESFLSYIESFLYDIEYGKGGHAWGHKCDGLALMAYDADAHSDESLRQKAVEMIASRNFDENDLSWLEENALSELSQDEEERKGQQTLAQAGIALDLTPRERQQGHCSRIVLFAYYQQLLRTYRAAAEAQLIARLTIVIERERDSLRALITPSV